MEQLAPAAVHLAAGLGAAREIGVRDEGQVVRAVAGRRVRIAPPHVEDLADRIGVGLAARAVRARDHRTISEVIHHRSITLNVVVADKMMLAVALRGPGEKIS
jgi:hypothetical protein